MILKRAFNYINQKKSFDKTCISNGLTLNFKSNRKTIDILSDIFEKNEYSDCFPFHKKAVIIDVGAHFGYFSIFASKNTDPQSTILAFEPELNNFNQLSKNIVDNNIKNIKIENCAIADKNENSTLYLGKSRNHSLVKNYPLLNKESLTQNIESKTLDQIILKNNIEKIDFLKLDCEGAEYSILRNMSKDTFDKIETISLEFHDLKNEYDTPESIIKTLTYNNFKIVKFSYSKSNFGLKFGKIVATKT